jgi:preprotein translocase subunit SecE
MARIDPKKLMKYQKPKPVKSTKENVFARIGRYFREVRLELKKVTWPSRPEVISSTIVVLTAVLFFTVFIGLLDALFVWLVKVFTFQF